MASNDAAFPDYAPMLNDDAGSDASYVVGDSTDNRDDFKKRVKQTQFGKFSDNVAKSRQWWDICGEASVRDLWDNKCKGVKWDGVQSKPLPEPKLDVIYDKPFPLNRMGGKKIGAERVVMSIGASFNRLENNKVRVFDMIQCILNQSLSFDAVYLVLPKNVSGRGRGYFPVELYDLERETDWFHIIRDVKDFGPITKFVAPLCYEHAPDTIVFVQDESVIVPDGSWYKCMYKWMLSWNCMVGTIGGWARGPGAGGSKFSSLGDIRLPVNFSHGTCVDTLSALGTVGFKRGWINDEVVQDYLKTVSTNFHFYDERDQRANAKNACFVHDDLVFSSLTRDISKKIVSERFIQGNTIARFGGLRDVAEEREGMFLSDKQGRCHRGLVHNFKRFFDCATIVAREMM